ncbi:protein CASC4-like isoform X2 [Pecten maximus]|uniref:protein CASC4-like isoform X2 n=1 Tax=Pecten maximus TaxID=6579 RepID=UPI0014590166|nr:protein CASC4-like isoform X2 [Pecten maximus]
MASNGRGSMRAQSRSPPFLVIGLLVALVILGANYWNLSSNNSKLAFEVAELQDQVRQISAKRISAEKKIDSMAESYNRNKDTLAQKESDVKSLNSQVEDKVGELQSLGKEKESCQNNLKNCEDNSNGIQQELLKVKEEVEQLKKKEQEEMSNTQKCDSVCADMRKMIIDAVEKTMGINAVQTLHQAGVDVGEYKDKLGGSQNQAQAEQPQKPEKPEVGEADAAQKPAQPQGGENLEAGKGAANPIQQQPAESNALPQGQINPQPGQGQSNMIPPAQVEGQSNPDNKPKNAEQADTNSLQKNNPAGIQIEANIIPPGQSNPDIPNPQVDQKILPPGNPPAEQGNPKVPGNHDNNPAADADDQVLQPGQVRATTAKPANSAFQDIADTLRKNSLELISNKSSLLGLGNFHNSLAMKAAEQAKQNFQGSLEKLKNSIVSKPTGQVDSKTSGQGQADTTLDQGQADRKTLDQGQAALNPREVGKEEVSAEVKSVQTTGKMVEMKQSKLSTKSKTVTQVLPLQNKKVAGQSAKDKDDYDDDYDEEDEKKTGGKGDGKKLEDNYDDDTDVGDEKLKFIPGNDKAGSVKAADDSIDTLEKKMKFEDQQK